MAGAAGSLVIPATIYRSTNQNSATPMARRFLEKAAQTFKKGVPVVIDATGYLIESPVISSALTIAGFSQNGGANLGSSGVPLVLNQGSPQNQPSGVIIPGGAWPNDGRCGVDLASDENLYILPCDGAHTPVVTDVTKLYGLTKDATSGQWFIDTTIVTGGTGAILEIVEIPVLPGDPFAPQVPVVGGKLVFRVARTAQQFFS